MPEIKPERGKRIAVFGGSFNPIHTGHAMIAMVAAGLEDIDEVWLMVSPRNPLKEEKSLMDENLRYELASIAVEDCPGVVASDFEFGLERPSYTYHTLCALRERYPGHRFSLLIGSDNWNSFQQWRYPERIIEEFGVIIYQRPDYPAEGPFPTGVRLLEDVPMMLLSSTYIRKRISEGKPVNYLLPDNVARRILEMKREGILPPEISGGSLRNTL